MRVLVQSWRPNVEPHWRSYRHPRSARPDAARPATYLRSQPIACHAAGGNRAPCRSRACAAHPIASPTGRQSNGPETGVPAAFAGQSSCLIARRVVQLGTHHTWVPHSYRRPTPRRRPNRKSSTIPPDSLSRLLRFAVCPLPVLHVEPVRPRLPMRRKKTGAPQMFWVRTVPLLRWRGAPLRE
jgi:hypothetical protein